MLAHYYDTALKDRFDEFFGRTDIGRAPTPLRNSFLVLQFDFSTIEVGTIAEIERNFWSNVKGAVGVFAVKYKVHSNFRAMPICLNVGQGVGVAAALAAEHGILPRDLPAADIQTCLLQQGVMP